ncbi:hypothetical protein [Actinoplanes sp. NPDC049118]|uniref:hypothetical protein n=1 Tax=Actinoplanes sp. NPDC049118 TaxID=3155769 RepID=UPI0033C48845
MFEVLGQVAEEPLDVRACQVGTRPQPAVAVLERPRVDPIDLPCGRRDVVGPDEPVGPAETGSRVEWRVAQFLGLPFEVDRSGEAGLDVE